MSSPDQYEAFCPHDKTQFQKFLSEDLDAFAWSPTDMPGIDPSIIYHKLYIRPEAKPVKQKSWKMK